MGVDKKATDIWKFGRPRPDLSINETMTAPEPELSDEERARRTSLMSQRNDEVAENLFHVLGEVRPGE